jgi:nudix motif 8
VPVPAAAPSSDPHHEGARATPLSSSAASEDGGVVASVWKERVADRQSTSLSEIVQRISAQELRGGRLRLRQYGVLHEDPATDMELLTQNYTVAAVASALRDREDSLQMAAVLASEEKWDELRDMLSIFHPKYVLQRRSQRRLLGETLNSHSLELIRKALMRMPRTVTQAHSRRAGVVLALCSVDGVPSLLLEKRSPHIRAHPDEVCLPGGMVCNMNDRSIVATCLREMKEEIGGLSHQHVQVLGILRCNWGEVHHLVGVAVTPVVCYLGELPDRLIPNESEVAEVFTIPLEALMDKSLWVYKEGLAPIFLGGPHVIWGLTGYILDRFYKDILLPNSRPSSDELV